MSDILVLLIFIAGLYVWITYMVKNRSQQGQITLQNGRVYTYTIGDDLPWYGFRGSHLRGIDIELPKEMPHIYLDSLVGGGISSRFIIDHHQRLQLEGNFNKHFAVFVPKRYEVQALSILSPDVMQTMLGVAGKYDFEIYGSHLRVISRRRVFKRPERQKEVLAVAAKLLAEVDHRLQSWSWQDSLTAREQDLRIYPVSGLRIGRHYIAWQFIFLEVFWVSVWLILCAASASLYKDDPQTATLVFWIGFGFFMTFSAVTIFGLNRGSFRSRRG